MRTVLNLQDRYLLFEFIEACHSESDTPGTLSDLARTRLHALLPHDIFALARMHTFGAGIFHFYGPDFPKEYLEFSRSDDGTVQCPMLSRWIRAQRPIYYDQKYRRRGPKTQHRAAAFADLGLRNIAVHGVMDSSHSVATCFGFARIGTTWCDRTKTLLRLITPHLHIAMLPRREPEHGSGLAPDPALAKLTQREQEVLHWLSLGKTTVDIGAILGIASNTVNIHTQNIVRKMGAANRVHAVAKALRHGMISP